MAVPKRKTSKQRKRKRRTHYKAVMPAISECSNCGETTRAHFACSSCGYYNNEKVFEVKEAK